MNENNVFLNLGLKSTINELDLYNIRIDTDRKVSQLRKIFDECPLAPGAIITEKGLIAGAITRKDFFEALSKPFSLELFNNRPIRVLFDTLDNIEPLILISTILIVEAVQMALERPKENFDNPILVEHQGITKVLDVYQLLKAHSEINKIAMDSLKEANDFKTELLSIVAHDLKNPLNSIKSLTKILIQDNNIGSEEIDMITQIYNITKQMNDNIAELLNTTAIQAGKIQLKKQISDIDEIISAIVYQNQPSALEKNQTITYRPDKLKFYYADVDAAKIRETFENIISNAIKYSPYGKDILIMLENNNNLIRFSVKDQGPGFSDEDKKKLYGKFQRLSALPTAGESSTGLGLYIAKQIINLHNGSIWVESEFGIGSTFFIELEAVEI